DAYAQYGKAATALHWRIPRNNPFLPLRSATHVAAYNSDGPAEPANDLARPPSVGRRFRCRARSRVHRKPPEPAPAPSPRRSPERSFRFRAALACGYKALGWKLQTVACHAACSANLRANAPPSIALHSNRAAALPLPPPRALRPDRVPDALPPH